MANPYYTPTGNPASNSLGSSALVRAEFSALETGLDKLPVLAAKADLPVFVKTDETGLESIAAATALTRLAAEGTANKDASGGYAGLTLYKINMQDTTNTFTSFFTNSNSAARTYTLPDTTGTVALTSGLHAESHTIASHSDTTATGAETETLTDGSDADALHTHTNSSVTITHASTTGKTANDHHNESHTIASHSDTTGTGAELETLTDGSDADTLHTHTNTSVTITHASATGKTANDHHNESHTVASHSDTTATGTELETLTDGSNADLLHEHAEISVPSGATLKGGFSGYSIKRDTDSDHDIEFQPFSCKDSTGQVDLVLSTVMTKQLDATFTAGDNAGGLYSGSPPSNTLLHLFIIRKDSDSSIDLYFDTSETAANIPSGYTKFRWVDWWITDSSANWKNLIKNGNYTLSVLASDNAVNSYTTVPASLTAIDISSFIPSLDRARRIMFGVQSNTGNQDVVISADGTNTFQYIGAEDTSTGDAESEAWHNTSFGGGRMMPLAETNVYWFRAGATNTSDARILLQVIETER